MQWAVSNIVGSVGWIAGLTCLKGGVLLPAKTIALFGQGQIAAGTILCASGAGVLLWANLGAP